MNNADMPASPVTDSKGPFLQDGRPSIGLTKREAFAKDAPDVLGRMARSWGEAHDMPLEDILEPLAALHVAWADALLSALQGDKPDE